MRNVPSTRSEGSPARRKPRVIARSAATPGKSTTFSKSRFLRAPQASMSGLIGAGGFRGLMRLPQIKPFSSMWSALGQYFRDPRLQQLFGRYATYCGSSPYLAPATLMLVAHVERSGVWNIEGGMHALAQALADGAKILWRDDPLRPGSQRSTDRLWPGMRRPACERRAHRSRRGHRQCRCGSGCRRTVRHRCAPRRRRHFTARPLAVGDDLERASRRPTDFRSACTTCFSLATITPNSTTSSAATRRRKSRRSMSARRIAAAKDPAAAARSGCWCSSMRLRMATGIPTIQRRWNNARSGHSRRWSGAAFEFSGGGRRRRSRPQPISTKLFPATGGALYGRSSHGWTASFQRPGARTRIPGLYLAGGSTHPGPGVPMAALSGRSAASSLLADLTSHGWSTPTAMRGGTSTR